MKKIQEAQIIIYQSVDGNTRLDVHLEGETVWLSQNQMKELFETTKQNISLHINNIYKEGELSRESTVKDFLTVQTEGGVEKKRSVDCYNLDVIISVGISGKIASRHAISYLGNQTIAGIHHQRIYA